MARLCPICADPLVVGEIHLHRGQVQAYSASWTGRGGSRHLRVRRALWAKVYVWARFHIKDRWCRSIGGHDFGMMTQRCGFCGLSWEEVYDLSGWNILKRRPMAVVI